DQIETTIPELNSLHKSFYSMIYYMRNMVEELKEATIQLEEVGYDLQQSSITTLQSSSDLVETVQIVQKGAESTANESEASIYSFNILKQKIEEICENLNIVSNSQRKMVLSANNGENSTSELIEMIDLFEADFEHLTRIIHNVQEESESIASLNGII